jgi:hypothetical protein
VGSNNTKIINDAPVFDLRGATPHLPFATGPLTHGGYLCMPTYYTGFQFWHVGDESRTQCLCEVGVREVSIVDDVTVIRNTRKH